MFAILSRTSSLALLMVGVYAGAQTAEIVVLPTPTPAPSAATTTTVTTVTTTTTTTGAAPNSTNAATAGSMTSTPNSAPPTEATGTDTATSSAATNNATADSAAAGTSGWVDDGSMDTASQVERTRRNLRAGMAADPLLAGLVNRISVTSVGESITLSGDVARSQDREAIEQLAREAAGDLRVINSIRVR